ncbi:MAG: SoxR reducing system RseC family protein [Gammaproteobacteria bacterium]
MIEETARVIATEAGFVWVETRRQSTCGGCAAKSGCGTAALAKVLGTRRTRVRAIDRQGVQVGDEVVVGIDESALIRGSLAVYAVPLLGLLAGAVLGGVLSARLLVGGEALTLGLGIAGLLAGLIWLKGFTVRIRDDGRYQPVVLRRLPG